MHIFGGKINLPKASLENMLTNVVGKQKMVKKRSISSEFL